MRLLVCLVLLGFSTRAQIINVESLRRVTDTIGWSGVARLNFQLIKNANTIFSVSNRLRIQRKTQNHLWLLINEIDFREANSEKLVSKNAQHFRHNYRFHPSFAWETFLQSQQNEIAAIRFRGLIGTGLRVKLTKLETYKVYFGNLIMYEYENSITDQQRIHKDWRNSSYVSFSLFPKDHVSIVSTTYFQPRYDKFDDFRISSQTSLQLTILKHLSFITTFSYQYDKFPVSGIPKEQYRLTNGITYSF